MVLARFKTDERFYHIHEQPTFFGNEIDLLCVYGFLEGNRITQKTVICKDKDDLDVQLERITEERISKKYQEY